MLPSMESDKDIKKNKELPVIRKAQEAIAIMPKSGKVTLLTRKLFNALLNFAQEAGSEERIYRRRMSELLTNASFSSNNTDVVKEQLRRMNAIQVEWHTVSDKGKTRWGVTTLLADAEILDDGGRDTWIEWSYSEKIKGRLLDPEVYAKISLQTYSQLRTSASAALYEICVRYVTSPAGITMREPWEWWRPRLTGNPEDAVEGTEYKIFHRDVLKKSIAEVNRLTDINIELIQHKNGRKVTDIQFKVTRVQQAQLTLPDPNLINNDLINLLVSEIGFSKEDAAKLYSDHDENALIAAIDFVRARAGDPKLPEVKSIPAMFRSALRGKWAETKKPTAITKKREQPKAIPELPSNEMSDESAAVLSKFDAMEEGVRNALLEEFAATNPLLASRIRKSPESMFVRRSLVAWLSKRNEL